MPPVDDSYIFQLFNNDEYFKKFIGKNREGAAQVISQSLTVAEQLNKLTEGIAIVDSEIQRLVLDKHEDLLSQATWIDKLEGVLQMMQTHLQSLVAGVERVRSRVTEPYLKLEVQLLILRRIWETLDYLRHAARIQAVSKRLQTQLQDDPNDLLKLSENIRELGELWAEKDMTLMEVLENEQQTLQTVRRDVSSKAKKLLVGGLQSQKESQVIQAVQVVFNLGSLAATVTEITQSSKETLLKKMKESLDTKVLNDVGEVAKRPQGRTGLPTPVSSTQFRPRLWAALTKAFDAIFTQSVQVEVLELCLRKPRSHVFGANSELFIDSFPENGRNIANIFWREVTDSLAGLLERQANDSVFFKQALEGEYPKFLRLYIDLCKRLQSAERPENFEFPFEMNKKVISSFEKTYLSKSVSMVLDPVHNMFSNAGVPDTDEVDRLINIIRSELSVALFDPSLSSTIARNITKAVRVFCSNCENIVDTSPEATQVIGSLKSVQEKNITIANLTEYLKSKLQSVMANLKTTNDATMIVTLSLVDADNLIASILNPVLSSMEKYIHMILLTMHKEDFAKEGSLDKVSTSLYMRELHDFINRAYVTYIKPFDSEDVVARCCSATGQRTVTLFMRHVSIVRPIGPYGRAKLVADCTQLEGAVAPLLGDDPKTFRILRSFRSLLTLTPQQFLSSPVLGEAIPLSLGLFYLFSYAPEEMKSPHQSGMTWSPEELSSWLDDHPNERDRLALVSGALGRYSNLVRQQPGRNFDPVYAVMAELISRSSGQ